MSWNFWKKPAPDDGIRTVRPLEADTQTHTDGMYTYVVDASQHLGMRRSQQDAFRIVPREDGLLAVVCDGMGGMKNGAEASATAIRVFCEAEADGASLEDAVEAANAAVYRLGADAGEAESTGTTLVAVRIRNGSMEWVSVGDSSCYLHRNHELHVVNLEHTYLRELYRMVIVQDGSVTEARRHPDGEALTQFIGMRTMTETDASKRPFPLQDADRILLCSDGLYRALNEKELADGLTASGSDAATRLVREALAKQISHQDNTTAITILIGKTP